MEGLVEKQQIRTEACLEMTDKLGAEMTLWDRVSYAHSFGVIDLYHGLRDGRIIDLGLGSIGLLWRPSE